MKFQTLLPISLSTSATMKKLVNQWMRSVFLSPPVQPARWAHMHRFPSVCPSVRLWLDQNYWTIIHNSKSIAPRVLKFGQRIGMCDPEVYLEGQGQRSKVKVTRSKNVISGLNLYLYRPMHQSQCHMGGGQRSLGSRSKVTGVKFSQTLKIMAGGLMSTSSCIFYFSHRGWQIGNRKQCLKIQWIFKQLKNSKTTSEGVNSRFFSGHWNSIVILWLIKLI